MEKIASFKINHETLLRGVYLSRKDVTKHGDCLSTFDVRLTLPNRERGLSPATRKYGLCPTIEACQCLMDIEQLG